MAKTNKAQAQGLGESKIFAADDPTKLDWSVLTIRGQAIPEAAWGVIPYSMTDQARAQEGKDPMPLVDIPIDKFDRPSDYLSPEEKRIRRMHDRTFDGVPAHLSDPLRDLKDQYGTPDRRLRLISPSSMQSVGGRGYEKVLDGEGKPVMWGNMFLGSIPEDEAQHREAGEAEMARAMMNDAQDKVVEQSNEIMSDRRLRNAAERRGAGIDSGFETTIGEEAETEFETSRTFR